MPDIVMLSERSRCVALLLCLFIGGLGVHRFYVGKWKTGLLMVVLCGTGISIIWAIIDLLAILFNFFRDAEGRMLR